MENPPFQDHLPLFAILFTSISCHSSISRSFIWFIYHLSPSTIIYLIVVLDEYRDLPLNNMNVRTDSYRFVIQYLSSSFTIPICSMVLEYLPTFTPKIAQFCR